MSYLVLPVLSGVTTGGTYESHKAALEAATVLYETRGSAVHGYTNQSYPFVADAGSYLTVTYYDNYDWRSGDDSYAFSAADALGNTPNNQVCGQATGNKSKVLGIETDQWLTTAVYFDDDYQTIQSVADLYPSGTEITSNAHDFTGNVTQTKVRQTVAGTVHEYNKWFEFDRFGRLQNVSQQITGDATNGKVTLASYTYDALGNMATKSIHDSLETETYGYDLTGRTIQSVSPSFSWWLGFDRTVDKMVGRYDGNIQVAVWQHAGETKKAYRYTYDGSGQMTSGVYRSMDSGTNWSVKSFFKETVKYETNGSGNIKWISRSDAANISTNITLGFNGYQLKTSQLSGQSPTIFTYDTDGNMITDGRRGLTVSYNKLNLPEEIVAGDQKVSYIYDAAGQKLACNANGSLTYYRTVMVYGNDNKLLYLLTPEGTVACNEGSSGTTYTYNYFKTDHLGSTRAMLSAVGGVLQASQRTDFYPFGLSFEYNNLNKNKYLFSGKELQDGQLNGAMLNWYDFGARFYDPVLGRWFNVDPAAQVANPYLFCGNSPMMYVDQDGRFWWIPLVIGAVIGGTMNVVGNLDNIHNFWGALGYFGIGAAVGAASAYAGGWMAGASKALGTLPGILAGGAMGGATGAASSFLLTGMNNVIGGQSFMSNMGKSVSSGLISGLISGAISGGIKGFRAAKKAGANTWSGSKVVDETIVNYGSDGSNAKVGVPPQADPTKQCYATALEYADNGRGNRPAKYFAELADNAKGKDPAVLIGKNPELKRIMNPTADYPSKMDITKWKQAGIKLNSGAEIIGTQGANIDNSHAVNILGLQFGQKLRVFGGGLTKLKLLNSTIWNPTGGVIQTIRPNFNKLTILSY